MKNLMIYGLLLMAAGSSLLQAQTRELTFDTKSAIYAANEEWLTFACEVPDGMVDLGSKYQSEMYWYSLYNFGNLLFRSGLGVHAVNNPLFKKHVEEDKDMPWHTPMMPLMGQRKFMMHKVSQFKAASGANQLDNVFAGMAPPKGAFPIYLEYASGSPVFQKDPSLEDWSTLRWDDKTFDKTLSPAAWGQSLMKSVLWTEDFFHGHRTMNGVTYNGVGAHDGAHGFRGSMLTALSLVKTFALKSELAYHANTGELGGIDPAAYDPMEGAIYYPHAYEANMKMMMMKPMMNMMMEGKVPPVVKKFKVTDPTSDLFDVASLLWGESEFYYVTDPKNENFARLYGDAQWSAQGKSQEEINEILRSGKAIFPEGTPHMLAKGISVVNFKNIMALHFNKKQGSLVDSWHPENGMGDHISTDNAAMAIMALANTYKRMQDVPKVANGAKMILTAQADFLLKQQQRDGGIANGFSLGSAITADGGNRSLLSQTFAIRAWLDAYKVTQNDTYLQAANKAYDFMETKLWSSVAGVYRSEEGASTSTYDGMNYGSTIGALRELAITRSGAQRRAVVARMDEFFLNVKNKNGLQVAEIDMTGEPIPNVEKAAAMNEKMAEMQKSDPEKAKMMMARMRDMDNDGVPKPKFVKGLKHGAAPITAGSITISTN